ncbi:LysR family transcriptional regulator [Allopusillimonas ginsengisoli]|uniref:LysR family transcriptional regulator n=1 Tax=Allopusillimonas ginsengisoli TaxID=453575 RepID=UPI0010228703|nr:LysR family transcriptional regulator [Allopusillimonas ginsengisoli]TEA77201.1 LysR family transcriptional regulator [Allopusillimonas ginsengisoli]
MKKLPDLEAWAIFAKVAETGSFARAATELSLSQATVSKAISRLEARTKTMLFHRTSRRISLTESGRSSLERATRILEEGEAIEAEVVEQATSLRGPIRLAAPMSFGLSHLAPMLPEFMQRHPDVTLEVDYNDELLDLVTSRFDLSLRISDLVDSSLLARCLCTVKLMLVGSPEYFQRHGHPHHPRELTNHRILQYVYSRSGPSWRFKHERHGDFSQVVPAIMKVNNAEALGPALRAGLGMALQPEFLVWQDLQDGILETAMSDWSISPISLHIVTPPGRRRPVRVRTLIEFLTERFRREPWAQTPPLW